MVSSANGSFRRVDLDPVDVSLVLDDLMVDGVVHTERGKSRFSDAWEALLHESRAFLPVTDAVVRTHDGAAPLDHDFLLVDKADIRAAFPKDAEAIGRGTARRIEVAPIVAALILEGMRVEGTVYGDPRKSRFSDMWEAILGQPRTFIPVTGARMTTHDGSRALAQSDFMLVEKSEVITAYPLGPEAERTAS